MHIVIGIITFRRPEGLKRLLQSLNKLVIGNEAVEILVVENDTEHSAGESICTELMSELSLPLRCVREPQRGIPFARNRIVKESSEADFIAMIDDDETADPRWLQELIRIQQKYDADVVAGPVLPRFLAPPPPWIEQGRFFALKRHATGTPIESTGTGNVLIRRSLFKECSISFDLRLAKSGGSDSHFFRRISRAGKKLLWADEAITYEWNPSSRTCARWIWKRAWRIGIMTAFTERDLQGFLAAFPTMLMLGGYRILRGLLFFPFRIFLGRHRWVHDLRQICYGAGMIIGMFGIRSQEYKKTHGK